MTARRQPSSNVCAAWAETATQHELGSDWACHQCEAHLRSKQALGVHSSRKHCVKRLSRHYFDGTHCVACLLESNRVIGYSITRRINIPACRAAVLLRMPRLSNENINRLDAEAAADIRSSASVGKRRVLSDLPCYRLQAPVWPVLTVHGADSRHPLGLSRRWL